MKKEVVYCESYEEYLFVCNYLNYEKTRNSFNIFPYIHLWEDNACNQNYIDNNRPFIYSFAEWKQSINNLNLKNNNKTMKKLMLDVLNKTYENMYLRQNTIPLFMSNPGMGKTTLVEEFAAKKGVRMLPTILSTRMPNEVCGGLMPNAKTKTWDMYDTSELASLEDGDIWFIDEVFNGTLKQTLDAALNVFQQRRLPSGKKLANIMIVAASNPQGLINLTPQIKERFIRYDLKFNEEEYQAYLKDKYGMPEFISANLCKLISKEKFVNEEWNYMTGRSQEKAINQIGCDLESPYNDLLLPYLSQEIVAHKDISQLNIKEGEKYKYIDLLKLVIQNSNNAIKSGSESKSSNKTTKKEKIVSLNS